MKIDVWHNILWSRYKAAVFTHLYCLSTDRGIETKFYQIAETETQQAGLSDVDLSWHQYPFTNLFKGAYSNIPLTHLVWKLGKEAARTKADLTILAGCGGIEHLLQALLLLIRGKRIAVFCDSTINDNQQYFYKGLAKRILYFFCDGIFCYGTRGRDYVTFYGSTPDKIFTGCHAAALSADYSTAEALSRRMAAQARLRAPRYLYVGRLSSEKRIETLLRGFAGVLNEHPWAELVIVGKGPEEMALKDLTRDLRIDQNVHFPGAKSGDALWTEYLEATCLVLPSRREPWGLVVNESLSFGCPVVVSDRCGCVPELVLDGRTGFVFQCDDIADLTKKLNQVPQTFRDTSQVARVCIDHIGAFSPRAAAEHILGGAIAIVEGLRRS